MFASVAPSNWAARRRPRCRSPCRPCAGRSSWREPSEWWRGLPRQSANHFNLRFTADALPRLSTSSNSICWPSLSLVSPAFSTAEICTNTSLPVPACTIKPKPFCELNHFTVPVAITAFAPALSAMNEMLLALGGPAAPAADGLRWPRLSEQLFRVDKWSACRG